MLPHIPRGVRSLVGSFLCGYDAHHACLLSRGQLVLVDALTICHQIDGGKQHYDWVSSLHAMVHHLDTRCHSAFRAIRVIDPGVACVQPELRPKIDYLVARGVTIEFVTATPDTLLPRRSALYSARGMAKSVASGVLPMLESIWIDVDRTDHAAFHSCANVHTVRVARTQGREQEGESKEGVAGVLEMVRHMPRAATLAFAECDLPHLDLPPGVTTLSLTWCGGTGLQDLRGAGVDRLFARASNVRKWDGLTNLREAFVDGGWTETIPRFATSLVRLSVAQCGMIEDIESLRPLVALEDLVLRNNTALRDVSALAALTNLRTLLLHDNPSIKCVDAGLQGLSQLVELGLQGCSSLEFMPACKGLCRLEALTISDCSRLIGFAPGFGANVPRLTEINAIGCTGLCSTAGLAHAAALKVVILHGCVCLSDMRGLDKLPVLEELGMFNTPLCDPYSLAEVANKTLRHVSYGSEDGGSDDLDGLIPMRVLERLQIARESELSDLSGIQGMAMRAIGFIDCNMISDIGPLAGMPLEELSLCGCRRACDLSPLAHSPTLRVVSLTGSGAISTRPFLEATVKVLLTLSGLEQVVVADQGIARYIGKHFATAGRQVEVVQ